MGKDWGKTIWWLSPACSEENSKSLSLPDMISGPTEWPVWPRLLWLTPCSFCIHLSLYYSLNIPSSMLPQSFCSCCSLCLECSSPGICFFPLPSPGLCSNVTFSADLPWPPYLKLWPSTFLIFLHSLFSTVEIVIIWCKMYFTNLFPIVSPLGCKFYKNHIFYVFFFKLLHPWCLDDSWNIVSTQYLLMDDKLVNEWMNKVYLSMAKIFWTGRDPLGQGIWLYSLLWFPLGFFTRFYLIKLRWKLVLIPVEQWLFSLLDFVCLFSLKGNKS